MNLKPLEILDLLGEIAADVDYLAGQEGTTAWKKLEAIDIAEKLLIESEYKKYQENDGKLDKESWYEQWTK